MFEDAEETKYYTPKEVAELLGVSDRSIYAYMRTGKMKFIKYRMREKLISEVEIKNFISKYWSGENEHQS